MLLFKPSLIEKTNLLAVLTTEYEDRKGIKAFI